MNINKLKDSDYQIMEEYIYRLDVPFLRDHWHADKLKNYATKLGTCSGIYRMIDIDRTVNLYQGETTSENKSSSCRLRLQSHRKETTGPKIRQYMKDNNLSEMRVRYEFVDMTGCSNQDIIKAQDDAILRDKPFANVRGIA